MKRKNAMRAKLKLVLVECLSSFVIAAIVYLIFKSAWWTVLVFCLLFVLTMIQPGLMVLDRLVKRTNWYKSRLADGWKFRKDIPCELDICNMGSNSGKYAFDYEGTGLKGENWAVGPQTLSYDFRILKNYFSYLKEGATVLLPLCPFSGCIKDFEEEDINQKYYSFLHPKLILNFSQETKKDVMHFVDNPFQHTPYVSFKRLIRDYPYIDTQKEVSDGKFLEKDAEHWINCWMEQFSITDLNATVSEQNKENIRYNADLLREIVAFCQERNLRPVMVLPPVTKVLSNKFSDTFRENYIYSMIRNATDGHVLFLNYLDDERFSKSDLFFDAYFLNKKGSRIFTDLVLNDLKLTVYV